MTASEKLKALDTKAEYWPLIRALPLIVQVIEAAESVLEPDSTLPVGGLKPKFYLRRALSALNEGLS